MARPAFRLIIAFVVALPLVVASPRPSEVAAGTGPKIVIVVGPTYSGYKALFRDESMAIYNEARKYSSNVVRITSPNATWAKVKAAAQGANIFVFFGHGNGYPSIYGAFHGDTKDGMGLDPTSGADGTRHRNYGEDYIRSSIRFAPNAVVLLYRMCYASGHAEPGLSEGPTRYSKTRVDYYGAGFLAAGARAVFATGYPKTPGGIMRQLFTTNRTMLEIFRASPEYRAHLMGPYSSVRTNGMKFVLDPNRGGADPAGFYHSLVGDLGVRAQTVTNRVPTPTPTLVATPSPAMTVDPSPSTMPEPPATPEANAPMTPTPDPTAPAASEPLPTPEPTLPATPEAPPTPEPSPLGTPEPTPTSG